MNINILWNLTKLGILKLIKEYRKFMSFELKFKNLFLNE